MKKLLLTYLSISFLFNSLQLNAQLSWQRMPGPPGGFAYGSFGMGTGGKWLRLGASSGVYESNDNGQTWRWNNLPGSIHSEADLALGTDGKLWYFSFNTLQQSSDNGRNWIPALNNGSNWTSNDVTNTIILDAGSVMLGLRNGQVTRSIDSSRTSTDVFTGNFNQLTRDAQTGHLYVWKSTGTSGQINPIHRSTDNGLTWEIWQNDPISTGKTITGLVIAPNGTAFLLTNSNVLRSIDDGANWTELSLSAKGMAVTATGRLLAEKEFALSEISQYSDDNGDTWQALPVDKMRKFSSMPGNIILAEHDFSGLYRSIDDGISWQFAAQGMPNHLDAPLMHFYDDMSVLAVTEQGVFHSQNGATNWQLRRGMLQNTESFLPGLDCAILGDSAICGWWDDQLWRSMDRGMSWQDITPTQLQINDEFSTIRSADGVLFCNFYSISGGDPFVLRSVDAGTSWQNIGNININPTFVAADGTFWCFTSGIVLQKSTDRGASWLPVATPSLTGGIPRIFPLPNGDILLLGGGKIHRSTNNGASWTTTSNSSINNVNSSFANSSGQLFAQAGSSLLTSVDNGQNWQSLAKPNTSWADNFIFLAPDQRIWFASGDGVWLSSEPSTDFLTIGGLVRNDLNMDCTATASEPKLPFFLIKSEATDGTISYGMSDQTGYFRALVEGGTYEISAVPPNPLWESCSVSVTIPGNITSGNYNAPALPVKPAVICPRLEIEVAAPLLRRCFDTRLAVRYRNTGTQSAENAQAIIMLDPYLDLLSSSFPIAQQSGDTLWFDLDTLDVNESGTFYLDVNVSCDAGLGQMHCTEAHITPDTLCSSWQGAALKTRLECLGDSVLIEIRNTGQNAMSTSRKWQVWRQIESSFDSLLVAEGNFFLGAGGIFNHKIAGTQDKQLILRAPQEPGYPFGSAFAQSFLLNCDGGNFAPYGYSPNAYIPGHDRFCVQNIGSFDPNDKTGFPAGIGIGHHIEKTEPLRYLIRFQNTGTDTAFTVVIRDTLSPLLDIETLQIGSSSHPMTANVRGNNELIFRFENILLPDSNINEAASHGFVQYFIQQKTDNPDGAVIRNRAGIYFDFNLPVLTNETWHTIGLPKVSGVSDGPGFAGWEIVASPNPLPSGNPLNISLESSYTGMVKFELIDMDGRVLQTLFREKTAERAEEVFRLDNNSGPIYIRVTAGAMTASRLILKP
ncbi:MAG: hypothetical protein R3A50_12195 [Saprospiraceae bacterium]